MSNEPADQHARDRAEERYGTKWDDRDCEEVLNLIRKCRWLPLELQGTRVVALLKYNDLFYRVVFETADLSLVTNLPFDLTPEQFERARKMFTELSTYGEPAPDPDAAPAAPSAPKPPAAEPGFFDSVVLRRFGRDKKKAELWWSAPNHELGAASPAELEARGERERVEAYLDRIRRENRALIIPERRKTAKLECGVCRGYPPPGMICRCEESR